VQVPIFADAVNHLTSRHPLLALGLLSTVAESFGFRLWVGLVVMEAMLALNHILEAPLDLLVFLVVLGVCWIYWGLRHRFPDVHGRRNAIARVLARVMLQMLE
jgi:hypothetical protein